ncbi:putative methyltransferase NSUN7 isoform X1 [Haplochromis burtoni]|uniref:putative methyltransferase NSUN7 isoform X1 n=2 Tax=Haplochromis burtoni TaxID=8153 RepID=UPI0006C9D2A8|nr:putative methyltransferase NSUN7 isoform X1 [Haplochromis burtoni]
MVKKKNAKGRHRCPFTDKTQKSVSHIASSKDLIQLDDEAESDTSAAPPQPHITIQSWQGFPDRVYLLASVIYQNDHLEKPAAQRLVSYGKERGLRLPEVKDEEMHRAAYELAFSTLKYQELLEDMMIDSCCYLTQPMPDEQMSLVAVMLYDFQNRKFLPRECKVDEIVQEVRHVEDYLLRFKTKLAASLARCRIKHDLLSIECILPESVKKKQQRSSNLPLYAWVNTLKSSLDEIQSVLKSAGFSQVKSIGQLEGQTFCQDPHCGDILVFPAQLKAQLYSTKLLSDHKLIIQDKSCSLGPNAVCSLLHEEGDVLMVGSFSGLTVSHTAALIAEKYKANSINWPSVYVCVNNCTDAQREELELTVSAMGCNNVRLILEEFQSLHTGDKRLQRVRVILLTPKCSVSAVSNPVDFILQENGDTDLLQDLSQGSIAQSKLESLVAQQRKDIDHALMCERTTTRSLPKVLAIVYATCSSYPEENADVVRKALQQAQARADQEGEPKQAKFRPSPSPFMSSEYPKAMDETDSFFMLEPTEHTNGSFLAVLTRVPEPAVKEAPNEVIARANAKGILDKLGSNHLTRKEQHENSSKMKKAASVRTTQSQLSVSIQPKHHQTKRSDSAVLCGHQDFTNMKQSSQEKPKSLRLQATKGTTSSSFSYSRPECNSSSCSSSKLEKSLHTAPVTTTLRYSSSSAAPAVPAARSRGPQKEVLKPVLFVLPPVHFPNFFPPQHSRSRFSPSLSCKWKRQTQIVSSCSGGSLSKDAQEIPVLTRFDLTNTKKSIKKS